MAPAVTPDRRRRPYGCPTPERRPTPERLPIPDRRPAPERRRRKDDTGFSLIELMVVVVILSILAVVIVPRVMDRPDQARAARVQTDLAALSSALNLYRLDNYVYPTTEQGLQALVQRPTLPPVPPNWAGGGYIDRLPRDPWGREYQYLSPGVHGPFDIFTLGADGVPGGTGANADIGTWDMN